MDHTSLIKNIELNFESLHSGAGIHTIGESIRSIVRDLNRLRTDNNEVDLQLKKIAVALMDTYTKQVKYSELMNKAENPGLKLKMEFDDSFFESLVILRKELFKAFEGIKKNP
jgi:hypothetical protein